jgi:hypothetical protein
MQDTVIECTLLLLFGPALPITGADTCIRPTPRLDYQIDAFVCPGNAFLSGLRCMRLQYTWQVALLSGSECQSGTSSLSAGPTAPSTSRVYIRWAKNSIMYRLFRALSEVSESIMPALRCAAGCALRPSY